MNLLKLLRDNATKQPQMRVENKDNSIDIYLYDVIDDNFGVSAEAFTKEISAAKGKAINLRINSPGGDVFAGRAMATAIKLHGNVTAYIDGIAASAATYVALAAKDVQIADGAMFMIHNAWSLAYGNKADMASMADLLNKIDQTIINDYVAKTGMTAEEVAAMMNAETWLSAQEALDKGFVNSIFSGEKVSNQWDLSAFENAPAVIDGVVEEVGNPIRDACERRLRLLK